MKNHITMSDLDILLQEKFGDSVEGYENAVSTIQKYMSGKLDFEAMELGAQLFVVEYLD